MAKRMTKIVALGAAALMALSSVSFSGCFAEDPSKGKSVLKIHYYSGGLGETWFDTVKTNFENMFANVSFEEGKTGVYVEPTKDKNFTDIEQSIAIGADKNDIFYSDIIDLNRITDAGIAYDVTDIYTEDVYDAQGNVKVAADGKSYEKQETSIQDKAKDDVKDVFNVNSKYYGIPYADCLSGIVVDYDLFEDEGWNTYSGMYGLPGTFDEFKDLLNSIITGGNYSAYTWSVDHYTQMILDAIIQKVDGDEGIALWNTYLGEYDFNNDGTISADETITPATAYKILDTRGYKAAYDFVSTMYRKENGISYYDSNIIQGVTYSGAQQDFLMSKTSSTRPRIAMILEGDWWENEARGTFTSMGQINTDDSYGQRDFRFMPIPQMTDNDKGTKYTIASHSKTSEICFVNKKTVENDPVKQTLCKLFLQYAYSNEALKIFTLNSGSALPYNYELTPSELASMTPFGRSVWDMHTSDEVQIVRSGGMARSDTVRLAPVVLEWKSKVGNVAYNKSHLYSNWLQMAQSGKSVSFGEWLAGAHAYYDDAISRAFAE